MVRLIIHRLFRLLFACAFLFICSNSFAQDDILKRQVQGREMKFRNSSSYDTFKTAQDACIQWGQATLPQGYTYHSYNMNDNGGCQCIFKKPGSADNDQGGQVWAIIVCPENASTYTKGSENRIDSVVCVCNMGYKPNGKVCELDTCGAYENMGEEALKSWAQAKLQKFCDEENAAFVAQPTEKMYPPNEPPIFTDKEIYGFMQMGGEAGMKKIAGARNKYTYADWVWPIVYGHAIERLVSRRVEKDLCLKEYVAYMNNANQTKEEDANPDFKGKGKLPAGVHFDVTTAAQVAKKQNNPAKAHFIFITYSRGLEIDKYGNPMPPGQTGPPPPKNSPKTTSPINTNPKTPAKPPKSSTDGR